MNAYSKLEMILSGLKNIAGLVLAAGGSRRMGSDKGQLIYNQKSFLNLAIALLQAVKIEQICINNTENMADLIADIGPLGGIYTALQTHPEVEYWLIVPIDMPLLSADIIQCLLDGLGDAQIARYEHEMFPLLLKTSEKMHHRLSELAQDEQQTYSLKQFMLTFKINILAKPIDSDAAFTNINSPEDFAALCI